MVGQLRTVSVTVVRYRVMAMEFGCFQCGKAIKGSEPGELGDVFVTHARSEHDWPYPDQAIRNYAEATQRLSGGSERLPSILPPIVQPVTRDRIDDWLSFFEHDAFVGMPEWADCYCLEPHVSDPDGGEDNEVPHWRANREAMVERLTAGGAFGYLAYVGGRPAGWVNASKRSDYALYRSVDPSGPSPEDVIGVSCFIVAPPYRRHEIASVLLDRVIRDAPTRGAQWIEAYPFNEEPDSDAGNFRGLRSMYDQRGFEQVEVRGRDTVVRRRIDDPG